MAQVIAIIGEMNDVQMGKLDLPSQAGELSEKKGKNMVKRTKYSTNLRYK